MSPTGPGPRFSLVCAVEGPGPGSLLASIAAQTFDRSQVEVVLVHDGDADLPELEAWATEHPGPVRIVAGSGGRGAATNAGLAVATGEWVSFPAAADELAPRYLGVVDKFLARNPTTDLVAANQLIWDAEADALARTHPLRIFFLDDALVDLHASEEHFVDGTIAAFFPRAALGALRFDTELGTTFVGGHFVACYLLGLDAPQVGFVRRARYHRRKPPYGQSRESTFAGARPTRVLFERGYTDLLDRARARGTEVPGWLRRQLGFEISRYLDSLGDASASALDPDDDPTTFHARIEALIEAAGLAETVAHAAYYLTRPTRLAVVSGYAGRDDAEPLVVLDKGDDQLGLVRLRYLFTGRAPDERLLGGDAAIVPAHAKTRHLDYLDRTLVRERILWVPAGPDLRVELDGVPTPVDDRRPEPSGPPVPTTDEGVRAQKAAAGWRARREFRDAWVFTDKIHAARDNGEYLFTFVRQHHREINAFFVVEEGTPCWTRLRAVHGRRVVAHGSHRWRVLMAHCREYISSHCDAAILTPATLLDFLEPSWRFSLVDHGVRKDDNAQYLNTKPLDLIVTTTPDETRSIAADGNGYLLTSKEAVQTGMPRMDRLRELGAAVPVAERRLLLVAPTWRNWLVPPLAEGTQRRSVDEAALGSEFVRAWTDLLRDPAIAELCTEHDLDLTLLPHPNIEAMLPHLDLPEHVGVMTYAGTDVQAAFARTRLLVTDYSSIAFDLAYIERPVVYYGFDEARFRSGQHTFRPGYFRQELHGFGPTAGTHDEAVAAIAASVRGPGTPGAPYDARIAATFPERDGNCCARTLAAIRRGRE